MTFFASYADYRKYLSMFDLFLCPILILALFSAPTKADYDENTFLELYGNNNETSGVWQAVRNIQSDEAKLRTLCLQAHSLTGSPITDEIDTVMFEQRTLVFTMSEELWLRGGAPIQVDVVTYNVTRLRPFKLNKNHFFHFTKGAKEGCIFYLIKWMKSRPVLRIGYHFCDVEVPA